MSERPDPTGVLWVTATCLVASVCFAGVVTTTALLMYVLPCVPLTAFLAWRVHTRLAGAFLGMPVLAYLLGQVVNALSGNEVGPAARSSFATVLCTGSRRAPRDQSGAGGRSCCRWPVSSPAPSRSAPRPRCGSWC